MERTARKWEKEEVWRCADTGRKQAVMRREPGGWVAIVRGPEGALLVAQPGDKPDRLRLSIGDALSVDTDETAAVYLRGVALHATGRVTFWSVIRQRWQAEVDPCRVENGELAALAAPERAVLLLARDGDEKRLAELWRALD